VSADPYFNSNRFSLVDTAYAPSFQRLDYLDASRTGTSDARLHPIINQWKGRLLERLAVLASSVDGLRKLFYDFIRRHEGYVTRWRNCRAHSTKR